MSFINFKYHKITESKPSHNYCDSALEFREFLQGFAKTNRINVVVTPETKTSLNLMVTTGSNEYGNAIAITGALDGFVTLERTMPHLFGHNAKKHFFRVSKKQGFKALVLYIIKQLNSIGVRFFDTEFHFYFKDMDTMTVDITKEITNWEE